MKFNVTWSKTYVAAGSVEVEADSREEAEAYVKERIGDYEGNTQYEPNDDTVEAFPQPKEE